MENEPLRVLVVDDSLLMRKMISDIINSDDDLEVIGSARNGSIALDMIRAEKPDIVTLDIEMPVMDGITTLKKIMKEFPIPVVMLSSLGRTNVEITFQCLDLGAVDFISKTADPFSMSLWTIKDEIISKVKAASQVKNFDIIKKKMKKASQIQKISKGHDRIIIIGTSTGGPKALPVVLSSLPKNLPAPVLLVQHMPEGFTKSFADRLNKLCPLEVKEAEENDIIIPGRILIAPGNKHMEVKKGRIHLTEGPKVHFVRPSVDVTMKCAVEMWGADCIGVILTGMGSDGVDGMQMIFDKGGRTIAQDKESCIIYGMPRAVVDRNLANVIVPLDKIAHEIVKALEL